MGKCDIDGLHPVIIKLGIEHHSGIKGLQNLYKWLTLVDLDQFNYLYVLVSLRHRIYKIAMFGNSSGNIIIILPPVHEVYRGGGDIVFAFSVWMFVCL